MMELKLCVIFISLIFIFSKMNCAQLCEQMYVTEFSTISVVCPANNTYNSTKECPEMIFKTQTRELITKNKTNMKYANRVTSAFDNATKSCHFHLNNFTRDDEEEYECSYISDQQIIVSRKYCFNITKMPSNMVIVGSVNGTIDGEDGKNLTLTCHVNSGVPPEELAWKHGEKMLAQGGPGRISYTFTQNRTEHLTNYTCVANNSKTRELSEHVRVNIKWKPDVSVYAYPNKTIQEGNNVTFSCNVNSNPPTLSVSLMNGHGDVTKLTQTGPCTWMHQLVDINRNKSGNYTCITNNSLGESENSIEIDVQYPPKVNIFQNTPLANVIILTCVPIGNPSKYVFESWQHQSLFKEHVRFITGYDNGTLMLGTGTESIDNYHVSGIYTCNVTNHVQTRMGQLYQFKQTTIKYQGKPVFLKRNEHKHFVRYGDSGTVQIYAYSNPKLTHVSLHRLDKIKTNVSIGFGQQSTISDVSFKKSITIQGYAITVHFGLVNEDSFRQYILEATNNNGVSNYSFNLCSANVPERPINIKVYPEANSIKIAWRRNFDGGYPQTFKAEIRSTFTQQWKHINITDKNLTDDFYIFEDLQPDHLYQIKISAFNVIGSSNSSEIIEIKTKYIAKRKILLFVLTGLVVISFGVGLGSAIHYMRKSGWHSACHKKRKDLCDQSSFEQGEIALSENVVMNNIYNLEDINADAGEDHAATRNLHELNYLDVSFESQPSHHITCIHGKEDRTIYSEVEFCINLNALPSSESDDDSSDDDFIYVDDIIQYTVPK